MKIKCEKIKECEASVRDFDIFVSNKGNGRLKISDVKSWTHVMILEDLKKAKKILLTALEMIEEVE